MKHTRTGVTLGLALAFAGLGGVVGAHLDRRIDLGALSRPIRGRD